MLNKILDKNNDGVLDITEYENDGVLGDTEYETSKDSLSNYVCSPMQNNFICDIKCKGLCAYCGNNLTKKACNCEEKNLKESPFSSLSQLDL